MVTVPELVFAAGVGDADGLECPVHFRNRQALSREQLSKQHAGFVVRDGRLHADSHETIGVVDGFPRFRGERAASVIRVAVVFDVQLGAVVREDLNDIGAIVMGQVENAALRINGSSLTVAPACCPRRQVACRSGSRFSSPA